MCSKMWPLEGSTRLSSAVRSAPAAEDRLDSRTSTALTRSPPQPFRMSSSTVGFWLGKIFFNTSRGGRLAFKLKGRETVPDGPSIRRWLCSAWYLGLSGQLSGLPPFFCTAYPPSSTDTISGLSGVKQFLLLTTSGELLWSVSLSLKASAALSAELLSPSRSSVKSERQENSWVNPFRVCSESSSGMREFGSMSHNTLPAFKEEIKSHWQRESGTGVSKSRCNLCFLRML